MDKQLQELKRKWLQDPADSQVAGRYISALERALGGVTAAKKPPKRLGWECPDPDGSTSVDGDRYCHKHNQWDRYCKQSQMLDGSSFDGEPCDYTYVGPAGLPGSPDGVCVYPQDIIDAVVDGVERCYVELLMDGDKVHYPVPAACKDEYWESCIFCGEPDERK